MLPLSLWFFLLPLSSAYNYCNNDTDYCKMEGKIHFICRRHQELVSRNFDVPFSCNNNLARDRLSIAAVNGQGPV